MTSCVDRRYYVYKIRRSDGMLYIGTTDSKCIRNRMCRHRSHPRFLGFQFEYEILEESDSPEVLEREAYYIQKYSTLHPTGLNVSVDGKGNHRAPKFTTRGYKFSLASRKKMSESSKNRIRFTGWSHSPETKLAWSKKRIGKCWKRPSLSRSQWDDLMMVWASRPVCSLVSAGKVVSYERAFAKAYSSRFGLTTNGLYNIVANRLKVFKFPGEYPIRDSHSVGVSTV